MSSSDAENAVIQPPLPQSVGYVVVVAIGLAIALGSSFHQEPSRYVRLNQMSYSDGIRHQSVETDSWRRQHQDRNVRRRREKVTNNSDNRL